MSELPVRTPMDVIAEALEPLSGRRVLDIGCGGGKLAQALTARGARVTGIDPQEEAVEAARKAAPEAEFVQGHGESLPFDEGEFDAAVFQNSLHHLPVEAMDAALSGAFSVVVPGGPVLVVEPLAEGTSFELLRPIDDESAVRAAALAAVEKAIANGVALVRQDDFLRVSRFKSFEEAVASKMAANPERASLAAEIEPELRRRFAELAVVEDGLYRLDQPIRLFVLRRDVSATT
ncbi:MAG TPA: class I SAM-dependent methyltransferase [Afifellaceae bacterium]|nr:class I SAM-dependent methyltransferase [Afifellaceae bacterium]